MVIRSGQRLDAPAEALVIGDIIEVKFGDRIPADIRIIKANSFKVHPIPYYTDLANTVVP